MYEKLVSIFGGNILEGVKDLIQTFKLPPEQQLQADMKLKELEHTVRVKAMDLDVEDRKSARAREMAIKDRTVSNLAYIIIGAFVGVSAFMVMHTYIFPDIKFAAETIGIVGTIVGYLSAKAEQVASYYFGSSHGSQAKTDALVKGFTGEK